MTLSEAKDMLKKNGYLIENTESYNTHDFEFEDTQVRIIGYDIDYLLNDLNQYKDSAREVCLYKNVEKTIKELIDIIKKRDREIKDLKIELNEFLAD